MREQAEISNDFWRSFPWRVIQPKINIKAGSEMPGPIILASRDVRFTQAVVMKGASSQSDDVSFRRKVGTAR